MNSWVAEGVSQVAHELAQKHDFTPVYEAADRHGVTEWLYRHVPDPAEPLQQYVSLAGWVVDPLFFQFESTAGLANASGFTRQTVQRSSVTHEVVESGQWDTFSALLVPALERAAAMYYQALDADRAGEAVVEMPYIARRQIVS
jgi:hypothetical protein